MMLSVLRPPRFSLRYEGSGKIEDMRFFMKVLYSYWYCKGCWGATASAIVDFLNTVALLVTCVIFTMRFDWTAALQCSEAECETKKLVYGLHFPYLIHHTFWGRLFGGVLLCSTIGSCFYEAVRCIEAYYIQRELEAIVVEAGVDTGFATPLHRWWHQWKLRRGVHSDREAMGLRSGDRLVLSTAGWGTFLEHICASVGRSGIVRFCSNSEPLDPLRAVQALMQIENFLIAVYEYDALRGSVLHHCSPSMISKLISSIFDAFHTVESRYKSIGAMRQTALMYAVMYLVGFWFFFVYSFVKVLVKNAAQFKTDYWIFSQGMWTPSAEWRFRLYNEVDYLHSCRLRVGRDIAARMVDRLRISNSLSRFVRRMCSICVFVSIVLSFLNPALLIGGSIGGLTLVWWLTIALMLYVCFPEADPTAREYAYAVDLAKLVGSIHYSASEWFESAEQFCDHLTALLYQNRLLVMARGLVETICTPFILLYAMQDGGIEQLVEFIIQNATTVDGVGSIATGCDWQSGTTHGDPLSADESNLDACSHSNTPGFDASSAGLVHNAATISGTATPFSGWTGSSPTGSLSHSEKVRLSIASFAAVYSQWTLRLMDGPVVGDEAGADETSLPVFLRSLNARVRGATAAERYTEEFASIHESMASPFTTQEHQSFYGQHGMPTDEEIRQSSSFLVFGPDLTTAHDRERLFVSQVRLSRNSAVMRGDGAATAGRRGAGKSYGAGST